MTATLMQPTDLAASATPSSTPQARSPSPAPAPPRTGRRALGPRRRRARPRRALTGVITHNPGDMTVVGPRGHAAARPERRAGASTASTWRSTPARVGRRRDGRRPPRHRRRRAGRAGARLPARPRDRRDARAGRRHGRAQRRPRDQERRGLRPREARARRLRDARRRREVVLRLHPLPHAVATLALPCPLEGPRSCRRPRRPVRPAALGGCRTPARCSCDRGHGGGAPGAGGVGAARAGGGRRRRPASAASPPARAARRRHPPEENADRPDPEPDATAPDVTRHRAGRAVGRLAPGAARRRRGGAARLLPRRAAPQPRSVGRGHERSGGHTRTSGIRGPGTRA